MHAGSKPKGDSAGKRPNEGRNGATPRPRANTWEHLSMTPTKIPQMPARPPLGGAEALCREATARGDGPTRRKLKSPSDNKWYTNSTATNMEPHGMRFFLCLSRRCSMRRRTSSSAMAAARVDRESAPSSPSDSSPPTRAAPLPHGKRAHTLRRPPLTDTELRVQLVGRSTVGARMEAGGPRSQRASHSRAWRSRQTSIGKAGVSLAGPLLRFPFCEQHSQQATALRAPNRVRGVRKE